VGRVVGTALRRRSFPVPVIEHDPALARALRRDGVPVLLGNAESAALLERAGLARARLLVLALLDPPATRQIVEQARRLAPARRVGARTHSEAEVAQLQAGGVGEAVMVMGERVLALEPVRHSLRRLGVSALEALAAVRGFCSEAPAGRPGGPAPGPSPGSPEDSGLASAPEPAAPQPPGPPPPSRLRRRVVR
jgi:CPA2 family monovalent cation:H+ antiporter-2